jgi:hypothetical protein
MTVVTVEQRLTLGARLARLHCPEAAGKIETLVRRDGNFRDMCEELADLDRAIMGGTGRDDVLAEWIAARDRLVQDMADALAQVEREPDPKGPSWSRELSLFLLALGAAGIVVGSSCVLTSAATADICPILEFVEATAGMHLSSLSREWRNGNATA